MRRFMLFLVVLFACCTHDALAASKEPLRVGLEDDYAPFSFKDSKGTYAGFDVDISAALCARLQRPCQMVAMPFEELFTAIQQGKLDVLVAGVAKNSERENFLSFVLPYYRSRTAFVGRGGEFYTQVDAQSLSGKRLTAQEGSVQHTFILENLGKSVYVSAATVDAALRAVRDGKADIALADSLVCMAALMAEDMQHLDYVAEPLAVEHNSSAAYIVVKKGQGELALQLREAFGQLRLSGEFNAINQKYFPFSIY